MILMNRRAVLGAAGGLAGAAATTGVLPGRAKAAPVGHEVYTASPEGAVVDSTVILGEEKAVLIDGQFSLPDGRALAEMIAGTGRNLETVVITHMHPDHHLGLQAIAERFPNARIVAHPAVAAEIAEVAEPQLQAMREMAPDAFAERVVPVEALDGSAVVLEGERIDILDPMVGDTATTTPVWVSQLGLLVASDIVFDGTHVWVAEALTDEYLDAWRASLDVLEGLGASVIVPGHRIDTSTNDAAGLAYTRGYLDAWQAALAETTTAEELQAAMVERVGELPLSFALDRAVAATGR
ncbi:MAG: MBL fold metallo-hydrolase [Pseudomonadota bacterium]